MQPSGYGLASTSHLDTTFAALADPTRRAILARLATGEASVNELARPFDMSQPAISKHLKVLEGAGLISRGRDAQRRPCRIEAKPLADANEWLEHYRKCGGAPLKRRANPREKKRAKEGTPPKPKRKERGTKRGVMRKPCLPPPRAIVKTP